MGATVTAINLVVGELMEARAAAAKNPQVKLLAPNAVRLWVHPILWVYYGANIGKEGTIERVDRDPFSGILKYTVKFEEDGQTVYEKHPAEQLEFL